MMFAGVAPERILQSFGKIHVGKALLSKSRRDLIASLRPSHLKHLRADNGDLPEDSGHCVEGHPDQSRSDFQTAARTLKILS
jgi:hypothetical protein